MNNLKNFIAKKWQPASFILMIFVAGVATGLLIMHQFSVPLNPVSVPLNPALALTIVPKSLSMEEISQGKSFEPTISFTNTSNRNWEFVTNGFTCFQFLDLKILDQSGKNHATKKVGDFYLLTADEQQIVLAPGETATGTVSMDLTLGWPLPPGTYSGQAFFDYKELHFASNVVRFRVIDH